jgi:hypothetical protein
LKKDVCPDGDNSPSYYDGTCEETLLSNEHSSSKTDKMLTAYQRAFTYGITTMPTVEQARLSDPLTRAELAKMLVVFVTDNNNPPSPEGAIQHNTGQRPVTPEGEKCHVFSDLTKVNAELQSFIIQVCELGLMGYYADGQTVKPAFSPTDKVTVAEIATILSRILRGETYRGSEQWRYHNHLLALQKAGIIP